jgi:zinc transport system substrate-binding protein
MYPVRIMNPMKRIFFILLVTLPLLSVPPGPPARGEEEMKVVTSFYPMYIMAKNVARDVPGVSLQNMAPPYTGCLHDYALTTDDLRKLSEADVLVVNGAGMESFLQKAVALYPSLKVIELSEGVPLIDDDPHVWVSITSAIKEVENLGKGLEEVDPVHKETYEKNTAEYVGKLVALREKMRMELAPYKGRPMITFHEAFSYFAKEFGLTIVAVVEREPGSESSARELAKTIDLIKKFRIASLFGQPQYPSAATQTIARETGAKVYVLDPAASGPSDEDAYIRIMEKNLDVLKKAFSENEQN